jgi:hypothetical protein
MLTDLLVDPVEISSSHLDRSMADHLGSHYFLPSWVVVATGLENLRCSLVELDPGSHRCRSLVAVAGLGSCHFLPSPVVVASGLENLRCFLVELDPEGH